MKAFVLSVNFAVLLFALRWSFSNILDFILRKMKRCAVFMRQWELCITLIQKHLYL